MKAIHKLDDLQRKALRKRITSDPVKMVKIKDLLVDLIKILSKCASIHARLRHDDLTNLAKEIFGEYPDGASMKATNITTYQWLFGFKDRARVYIDCETASKRKHRCRAPITAYHIYCAWLVLSKLRHRPNISCPISIDQQTNFDPDDVIEFLVTTAFELNRPDNQSIKPADFTHYKQPLNNVHMQDGTADDNFSYPRNRSFGELLYWHLFINGTRPDGSPNKAGHSWSRKEFAHAVRRDYRVVGNWLRNNNRPLDVNLIIRVLFGEQPAYESWKNDLQFSIMQLGA